MGNWREKCRNLREVVWSGEELDWVHTAPERRLYFRGVGLNYLVNKAFEEGFRKLIREYSPSRKYALGLIIPCSYGKPYSQSFIHYFIRRAIREYLVSREIHEVIVTNAGVVPRELDEFWPYCAYDWNPMHETPEAKECYVEVLSDRLAQYLRKNMRYYEGLAAFLRWSSDSWRAVEEVSKALGVEIPNLAPKDIPSSEVTEVSLEGLYQDPDLELITPTALEFLRSGVEKILKTRSKGKEV